MSSGWGADPDVLAECSVSYITTCLKASYIFNYLEGGDVDECVS